VEAVTAYIASLDRNDVMNNAVDLYDYTGGIFLYMVEVLNGKDGESRLNRDNLVVPCFNAVLDDFHNNPRFGIFTTTAKHSLSVSSKHY
jgi:hypothetical protein